MDRLNIRGLVSDARKVLRRGRNRVFTLFGRHPNLPAAIRLEACSACQLRCPSCPTPAGLTARAVGKGFLRGRDFRRLVDANPWLIRIELSNYGEIFLSPEILDILKYADHKGVILTCSNGANFNHVREEVLDGLVRYRLHDITVSLDGATEETYGRYRIGGSLERALANVRRINELKRQYRSPWPRLRWQFILFDFNAGEFEAAKAMARDLGMEFFPKMTWDDHPAEELNTKLFDAKSRKEFLEKTGHDIAESLCAQLWNAPQINWDGKVLGCCRNFWGDFGTGAFENLAGAINGEKMNYARAMLTGAAPAREDIPCTTCSIYKTRAAHRNFVSREL